jgi:hypothetical protein
MILKVLTVVVFSRECWEGVGKHFFLTLGLNKTCSELIVKGIYVILYTYDSTMTDLVYAR